jgi:hypothetical protein
MRNVPITRQLSSALLTPAFEMKTAKRSGPSDRRGDSVAAPVTLAIGEPRSAPAFFAKVFDKLDLDRRARLLGRLLGSVGPLGLVVVAGGNFAKYLRNARSTKVPVSLEDAAHATPRQIYEVVRYVEQSNPRLVQSLLVAFWQDRTAMKTPCA